MPIKEGHGLTSVARRIRIEEFSNVEILSILLMLILTGTQLKYNSVEPMATNCLWQSCLWERQHSHDDRRAPVSRICFIRQERPASGIALAGLHELGDVYIYITLHTLRNRIKITDYRAIWWSYALSFFRFISHSSNPDLKLMFHLAFDLLGAYGCLRSSKWILWFWIDI